MELSTHEQYILASDRALSEVAHLIVSQVPLSEWPKPLRVALWNALAQGCDDTRLAKNRINAVRANALRRFLVRRKIDNFIPEPDDSTVESEYITDRLLADLTSRIVSLS
ncbi:MAG: hypothetical protein PHX24_01375 [Acidithiobacillus sp.]|nr:hypothetical protein [Acidithiobacillus sp.]